MTPPPHALVGIDCATEARNVGLALATWNESGIVLREVACLRSWGAITETVASWCTPGTLLALDAPLGWPTPMGEALASHMAGAPIEAPTNALFRRATDDFVARHVGKRPLDVGADRIARTAHRALAFLGELRAHTSLDVPLAWQPGPLKVASAIEVYPAATLVARGWLSAGYKGSDGAARRGELVTALTREMAFSEDHAAAMRGSDRVLDAALCCLAAGDFLRGDVLLPVDRARAEREGWIWVRGPDTRKTAS